MIKRLSPRYTPITKKWQYQVYSTAGIESTKKNRKYLHKLYIQGYSHKSAAALMIQFEGDGNG